MFDRPTMQLSQDFQTSLLTHVQPFRHVIWDWNGTIVDDVNLAVHAISEVMEEFGLSRLSVLDYKEKFGFPIIDYYKRIGFDLDRHDLNVLAHKFHDQYNQSLTSLSAVFPGTDELLTSVRQGRTQSILSAGAQWHLDHWVKIFSVDHHFDYVYGINDHFAVSKVDRGRQLIAASGVAAADTIIIGDTDHDVEVARELGATALLIADGHQSYERLRSLHNNVIESRLARC